MKDSYLPIFLGAILGTVVVTGLEMRAIRNLQEQQENQLEEIQQLLQKWDELSEDVEAVEEQQIFLKAWTVDHQSDIMRMVEFRSWPRSGSFCKRSRPGRFCTNREDPRSPGRPAGAARGAGGMSWKPRPGRRP